MGGRTSVSSSSLSSGGKVRTREGKGFARGHTASLARAGNGIPMAPKPQLLPQLTGTNKENERAGGGGDWPPHLILPSALQHRPGRTTSPLSLMGKPSLRKGPDLALMAAASPGKATPLAWAWLWELAAHREAGLFAAGMLGSAGLTGKPSGPGASQCPPPGLGSRVSTKNRG